jgi:hypothetical protein
MEMQSKWNDPKDCLSCKKADLLPENRAAWELYQIVRSQYITAGMDGTIIDINHSAIVDVLKLYQCYNTDTFEKILCLSHLDIMKIHKQRAAEYEKNKNKK